MESEREGDEDQEFIVRLFVVYLMPLSVNQTI
jgi:hypothetical protein